MNIEFTNYRSVYSFINTKIKYNTNKKRKQCIFLKPTPAGKFECNIFKIYNKLCPVKFLRKNNNESTTLKIFAKCTCVFKILK